ncbi:methyl-accepting chemotaxis protein [Haloimpatiens sp. FM7315]|uniref:methyl-accepting chemotaxis protein n=1 Tax=Haloimpatiens sp. FM7315 TaxID=3298609 RepID=UPI0035A3C190
MKKVKFKSLKNQLLISFIALIGTVCIGISLISMYISKRAVVQTVNTTLPEIAKQASFAIENKIKIKLDALEVLAEKQKIKNKSVPMEEKLKILSEQAKISGYLGMSFVDAKGNLTSTDGHKFNISDQEGFKKAMKGISNISDPIVSKTGGKLIVIYDIPVKNNGIVIGCISAARDGNELSNYINDIKFGKTGQAFIINKSGTTIADNNKDLVLNRNNDFENLKKDSEFKQLVQIEKKMVAGENGIGKYSYKGKSQYIGYAPIAGTDWSIGNIIETNEILKEIQILKIGICTTTVAFILIGAISVLIIAKTIINPINISMEQLKIISEGDLREEIPKELLDRKDELGKMAKSINNMRKSMMRMLNNIKTSSSNIDIQNNNLNEVAEGLNLSSQSISVATNEAAKGTSDQAQHLIDITSILKKFSSELNNMVGVIKNVDLSTNNIKTMAYNSSKHMDNVIKSVENVNYAFKELISKIKGVGDNITKINEITNLINNISEQTNLLALNAAIEAARAGEEGRGFSVVADEIRKLAEQSKDSASDISNLLSKIDKDTTLMVNTTDIVKNELENQQNNIDTAIKSFETITGAVDDIAPKIAVATNSVEDLNNNKKSIIVKIETASSFAEEVSASNEEIVASTQEMNKSTENLTHSLNVLNDMSKSMIDNVNKFKI